MDDIEISRPMLEPTICGPVSDFKELTLSSNAITMGEYGTVAGIVISATAYFGYYYAGPWVVAYGKTRGWWS